MWYCIKTDETKQDMVAEAGRAESKQTENPTERVFLKHSRGEMVRYSQQH